MRMPPSAFTTVGIAVATTVDSMAARNTDSMTPTSARRLRASSINGRRCSPRTGAALEEPVRCPPPQAAQCGQTLDDGGIGGGDGEHVEVQPAHHGARHVAD